MSSALARMIELSKNEHYQTNGANNSHAIKHLRFPHYTTKGAMDLTPTTVRLSLDPPARLLQFEILRSCTLFGWTASAMNSLSTEIMRLFQTSKTSQRLESE